MKLDRFGEVDVEARAVAELRLEADAGAVGAEDAERSREAEAAPLRLGGEERFADAGERLRVHAGALVLDDQLDDGSGLEPFAKEQELERVGRERGGAG